MSGGGLELSFVTDDEGWLMFDSMTADAVSMAPVIESFDTVVADTSQEVPKVLHEVIKANAHENNSKTTKLIFFTKYLQLL